MWTFEHPPTFLHRCVLVIYSRAQLRHAQYLAWRSFCSFPFFSLLPFCVLRSSLSSLSPALALLLFALAAYNSSSCPQ
eukprot:m.656634 g.656634  ORF g.656634 m.656634 type:complete len:78 (+) comp58431_c0_seq11:444-677(+)